MPPFAQTPPRRSVLLLCDDDQGHANAIMDHVSAFLNLSRHDVRTYNPRGRRGSRFLDLEEFDVVVIHFSLVIISPQYLGREFCRKIRDFRGLKVQYIQDDYRWVYEISAMMRWLGIHVLFTLVPDRVIPQVWEEVRLPGVLKRNSLAGYVPDRLVHVASPPLQSRPLDIGYRGRILPYWLGRLAQEKVWIGQGVLARSGAYGLRCDIAWREQDRIYGKAWDDFLRSCKATLGTESGASITDFDGIVERRTRQYLKTNPSADFETVYAEFLHEYDGNVMMNVISPKLFEAIAHRTALILFPGEYAGILQPWTHYVPLEKDFSNMDRVVAALRDVQSLEKMVARAHADVIASGRYSYAAMIREFDEVVTQCTATRPVTVRRKSAYRLARVERSLYRAIETAVDSILAFVLRPIGLTRDRITLAYLRRTLFLFAGCLTSRESRQILRSFISERCKRNDLRLFDVLKDLARLTLASRLLAGREVTPKGDFRIELRLEMEAGIVTLVSVPGHRNGSAGAEVPGPWRAAMDARGEAPHASRGAARLAAIAWDHSAIGSELEVWVDSKECYSTPLGAEGHYRFEALGTLCGRSVQVSNAALALLGLLDRHPSLDRELH